MSQIIVAQNIHGIVLAAENRALHYSSFSFAIITREGYQSVDP